jgi:hypothetical protein
MEKLYLNKLLTTVSEETPNEYKVLYSNGIHVGSCSYKKLEMMGSRKPIRQDIFLMTNCDMTDIIGSLNNEYPFTSDDHNDVQREIRFDSLTKVRNFVNSL